LGQGLGQDLVGQGFGHGRGHVVSHALSQQQLVKAKAVATKANIEMKRVMVNSLFWNRLFLLCRQAGGFLYSVCLQRSSFLVVPHGTSPKKVLTST